MSQPLRSIIVFKGDNEFEAQMARDILIQEGVPVLHVPSLSTGVFGFRQTTRVAVPETFADQAVATLVEAGFAAGRQERPRGAGALSTMAQEALPLRVRRLMILVWVVAAAILAVLWWGRH